MLIWAVRLMRLLQVGQSHTLWRMAPVAIAVPIMLSSKLEKYKEESIVLRGREPYLRILNCG
jgi:hypothetical protein